MENTNINKQLKSKQSHLKAVVKWEQNNREKYLQILKDRPRVLCPKCNTLVYNYAFKEHLLTKKHLRNSLSTNNI